MNTRKGLVTVQSVRAANGRIIAAPKHAALGPSMVSTQVSSKIRDVRTAATYAMREQAARK